MDLFNRFFKKKKSACSNAKDETAEEYLDDITFIRDVKHISNGAWHQYDVLLAARGYGWGTMLKWADYMSEADLENISEVTVGSAGVGAKNITESYRKGDGKCAQMSELTVEQGYLSLAGMSMTLKAPMKIVWFNQTRVLRFFTLLDDENGIRRYAETVSRRTFGTENAMKLGKPIPKEE